MSAFPTRQARALDPAPPLKVFFDRHAILGARLIERNQPAFNGGDDFRLEANSPMLRGRGRETAAGDDVAVGPDHVNHGGLSILSHANIPHSKQLIGSRSAAKLT